MKPEMSDICLITFIERIYQKIHPFPAFTKRYDKPIKVQPQNI